VPELHGLSGNTDGNRDGHRRAFSSGSYLRTLDGGRRLDRRGDSGSPSANLDLLILSERPRQPEVFEAGALRLGKSSWGPCAAIAHRELLPLQDNTADEAERDDRIALR
jgi:hypothetical protein